MSVAVDWRPLAENIIAANNTHLVDPERPWIPSPGVTALPLPEVDGDRCTAGDSAETAEPGLRRTKTKRDAICRRSRRGNEGQRDDRATQQQPQPQHRGTASRLSLLSWVTRLSALPLICLSRCRANRDTRADVEDPCG